MLDRAYGKPTQFLAADDDVVPANLSAAELRAEMLALFQQTFPEYRGSVRWADPEQGYVIRAMRPLSRLSPTIF